MMTSIRETKYFFISATISSPWLVGFFLGDDMSYPIIVGDYFIIAMKFSDPGTLTNQDDGTHMGPSGAFKTAIGRPEKKGRRKGFEDFEGQLNQEEKFPGNQ